MKIILSTKRLPEYENYLKSSAIASTADDTTSKEENRPNDYTLQLPIKKKSRTRSTNARKRKEKEQDKNGHIVQDKDDMAKIPSKTANTLQEKEINKDVMAETTDKVKNSDTHQVGISGLSQQSKKRKFNTTTTTGSQISCEATQLFSQI